LPVTGECGTGEVCRFVVSRLRVMPVRGRVRRRLLPVRRALKVKS
jgi:hypothetical protein